MSEVDGSVLQLVCPQGGMRGWYSYTGGARATYTVILGCHRDLYSYTGVESDFYSYTGGQERIIQLYGGDSLTLRKVSQSSVYGTPTTWVQSRCLHMKNSWAGLLLETVIFFYFFFTRRYSPLLLQRVLHVSQAFYIYFSSLCIKPSDLTIFF